MVETHSQKSKREAKESQESANMSGYEYNNDIFFNSNHTTLPDMDIYTNIQNIENMDNTNNNDAQYDNVDNILVHLEEVEDTIMDPHFNKMIQEIMRRDRQYFLLVMLAQSGAMIPHDFDMSQIIEN